MLEFLTKGFNGYSVKYSPFFDSRIAAATSANFGLVGNGRLYILNLTPNGVVAEKWFVMHRFHVAMRKPLLIMTN
jgi:peroxin-7